MREKVGSVGALEMYRCGETPSLPRQCTAIRGCITGLTSVPTVPAGSCQAITRRQHRTIRSAVRRCRSSSGSGASRVRSSHHLRRGDGSRASRPLNSRPLGFPMPSVGRHDANKSWRQLCNVLRVIMSFIVQPPYVTKVRLRAVNLFLTRVVS
jgi:hypothetical protein